MTLFAQVLASYGWLDHSGQRHAQRLGARNDLDQDPRCRIALDHRGLWRRWQLHRQHIGHAEPGRQPGCDLHGPQLVGRPVGLRAVGDLHSNRQRGCAGQRHADWLGHGKSIGVSSFFHLKYELTPIICSQKLRWECCLPWYLCRTGEGM